MIIKDDFIFSEQRNLNFKNGESEASFNLYKSETTKRIFFCAKGDADLFFDDLELNKLKVMVEAAISRSHNEARGFCGILISPQLGDFSKETFAVVQVVFANKYIGIGIDMEDSSQGVELWSDEKGIMLLLNELKWLIQR